MRNRWSIRGENRYEATVNSPSRYVGTPQSLNMPSLKRLPFYFLPSGFCALLCHLKNRDFGQSLQGEERCPNFFSLFLFCLSCFSRSRDASLVFLFILNSILFDSVPFHSFFCSRSETRRENGGKIEVEVEVWKLKVCASNSIFNTRTHTHTDQAIKEVKCTARITCHGAMCLTTSFCRLISSVCAAFFFFFYRSSLSTV